MKKILYIISAIAIVAVIFGGCFLIMKSVKEDVYIIKGGSYKIYYQHQVTFDYGYDDYYVTIVIDSGEKVSQPDTINRTNYEFEGWYLEQTYETEYDFSTNVNRSYTLYAKYNKINIE